MDRPTASASTLDVNPATVGVSEAASVAASLGAPGGWFGPDGSGVGVAVLDSGAALMPDIALRIAAFKDFVGSYSFLPYDDYGHGTHVAGIVAGSGLMSSSLIATRTYRGIAPGSSLIIGKVLDGQGRGTVSNAIAGIDWCIAHKAQYNIRVINLSLGSAVLESYKTDPLCQAAEKAVAAGIVVVVAAGNNQLYGSICSPGNDPAVITVGAVGTNGTAAHVDDSIAWYSSRGPSLFDASLKPDIVAPGTQVVSVRAPGSWIDVNHPETNVATSAYLAFPLGPTAYTRLTGTSMAAPAVAGAAAVLLQVNPLLTPSGVKAALMLSAGMLSGTDLLTGSAGIFDPFTQGAGELDLPGAVELAYRIRPVVGISGSPSMASTIGGRTFSWSLATLPGLWSLSGSPATLLNGGAATWASALWSGAWSDALIWGGPVSFSLQNGVVYAGNLTWGGGNRVPDGGTAWASNLTWGGGSRVNPNPYTDATNMTWGGGSVNRVQDPTGGLNLTWGGGGPN